MAQLAIERIIQPTTTRPIVDENGLQSQEMRSWTQIITNLALIIGDGSPEGVVPADIGQTYQDRLGTAGLIRYAKRDADIAGDITKGWILI